MSRETLSHLNTNTLIGYTDKRGTAWHYRADEQGDESNHYTGAIPVDDVRRRLFSWEPIEVPMTFDAITDSGVVSINDPSRKIIVRPDTATVLGVFRDGYKVHGYDQWLIRNVENLLDADLAIGSAGLLRGGAVAWVQIEVEDTITVAGVDFRPFLTAVTSLDGSLATTYQQGAQVVVCDNTLSVAMSNADAVFKVRHTAGSLNRLQDARTALGIVHSIADDFTAEVQALTSRRVSPRQWDKFLAAYVPVDPKATLRAKNAADKKRAELDTLWKFDERVSPWIGTAYGVLAAANTHLHHFQPVRGATRAERNAERMVTGQIAAADANAMRVLTSVLS